MKVRVLPGSVLDDNKRKYVPGDELEMGDAEGLRRIRDGKVEAVVESGAAQKGKGNKKGEKSDLAPDGAGNQPPASGAADKETAGDTGADQ